MVLILRNEIDLTMMRISNSLQVSQVGFSTWCNEYFLVKKSTRSNRDQKDSTEVIGPIRSTPKSEKRTKSKSKVAVAEKDASGGSSKSKKVKKELKLDTTIKEVGEYEFEIEDPDSIERGKYFSFLESINSHLRESNFFFRSQ